MEYKTNKTTPKTHKTQVTDEPPVETTTCYPFLYHRVEDLRNYGTVYPHYPNRIRLLGVYQKPNLIDKKAEIKLDFSLCEGRPPNSGEKIEVCGYLEYGSTQVSHVLVGCWVKLYGDLNRYQLCLESLKDLASDPCKHMRRDFS